MSVVDHEGGEYCELRRRTNAKKIVQVVDGCLTSFAILHGCSVDVFASNDFFSPLDGDSIVRACTILTCPASDSA